MLNDGFVMQIRLRRLDECGIENFFFDGGMNFQRVRPGREVKLAISVRLLMGKPPLDCGDPP
jgi:hypothetical protein